MRITVVGAGAVGSVFGGLLAHAGEDVSFLARGQSLEAIRSRGLRVLGPFGVRETRPLTSDAVTEIAARGPADAILVAVKAWQVNEVASSLRPLVGEDTVVVPLQNGVEAAGRLAAALGERPVVGGLCQLFAWMEGPGVARTTGSPLRITVGERRGGSSPRLERLAAVLRKAQIEAIIADDVEAALWEKLLFVEPFGSVGAVTRSPVGALRSVAESRALLASAVAEIVDVARAHGVRMTEDAASRTLARLDELPAEATASMQRDIAGGRASELEDQTGAVVRLGGACGVETPAHRFLLAALLPQERAARRART